MGGKVVRQVCPEAERDVAFWWRRRTEADELARATAYAVGLVLTHPDISLRLANGKRANKQQWDGSDIVCTKKAEHMSREEYKERVK